MRFSYITKRHRVTEGRSMLSTTTDTNLPIRGEPHDPCLVRPTKVQLIRMTCGSAFVTFELSGVLKANVLPSDARRSTEARKWESSGDCSSQPLDTSKLKDWHHCGGFSSPFGFS